MKKILVACGNGIATSTMVVYKIKERLELEQIEVSIDQCKLTEVPSKQENYDLVVTTGFYDSDSENPPVINAISLITGVNETDTLDKIINSIKVS